MVFDIVDRERFMYIGKLHPGHKYCDEKRQGTKGTLTD